MHNTRRFAFLPQDAFEQHHFNPAISLVLQGGLTSYSQNPKEFHVEGMPLGGEAGLQDDGLAMWETELTASANIDNLFYGQTTLGLHSHEGEIEVDVEEAFVDTLALPDGFGLRVGRFFSSVGYLNEHHTHAWDFADAPLAYQAFLGGQHRDDGIRASWVVPLDSVFFEVGAEALRGGSYPGGGNTDILGGLHNLFAKVGGDIGQNNSWQSVAEGLEGKRAVVHHREWIYLLDWLGLQRAGSLEPKPGIPPNMAHLAELKQRQADLIILSPANDTKPATWLKAQTGTPIVVLPQTVGAVPESEDLFDLFDEVIRRLSAVAKK